MSARRFDPNKRAIVACDIVFTEHELVGGMDAIEMCDGLDLMSRALAADRELATYHICLSEKEPFRKRSLSALRCLAGIRPRESL